jgi:glycine betaine/choline ABC-type transport system substrate-binding protein
MILIVLDDDKKIFPPYYAAPIVRTDASLEKFPDLEKTLKPAIGQNNRFGNDRIKLPYRLSSPKHPSV